MDDIYEELNLISPDSRAFSDKLKDLQCVVLHISLFDNAESLCCRNPTLARRIHVLTVWPSAVREALHTEDHISSEPLKQTPPHASTSILGRGRSYVDRLLDRPKRNSAGCRSPSPFHEDQIEMFYTILQSFTHLEEVNINWFFDKGTLAWKFSLFPDIWRCLGGHCLRRLSIDTYMHKLSAIVSSSGSLINLEHLHLTLRHEPRESCTNDNAVPYFINKLAPSLQSLSLKTIGHQDLSFFKLLVARFPHLTKLSLAIPFDSHHLTDPSGLHQLLSNQLQHLSLRHQFCCGNTPEARDAHRSKLGNYDIYNNISLPSLQSLEFGLNMPLSREMTSVLMRSVGALGQSVTSLFLKDHSLTLDELKIVLESFPSQRLKKLSLFARLLTPQLIDVIARYCPVLNSLTMDVQSIAKSEWQSDNDVVSLFCDNNQSLLYSYMPAGGILTSSIRLCR